VSGTPTLALNSGGSAPYASGTGTSTLPFTYLVGAGQNSADLDYTSTGALSLNGGSIADIVANGAANNATLTLPSPGAAGSLGANKNIVIDTTAPTVTSVSSTTANGTYGVGVVIPIPGPVSQPVAVTGTPQLTLSTGSPSTTTINYASGTGTSTLTFNYTVAAGNSSLDLDYATTSSLALNGGTIKDVVAGGTANDATLTLASPGA